MSKKNNNIDDFGYRSGTWDRRTILYQSQNRSGIKNFLYSLDNQATLNDANREKLFYSRVNL